MTQLATCAVFCGAALMAAGEQPMAQGASRGHARAWQFNSSGEYEGWTAAPALKPAVMGGALWIRIPTRDAATVQPEVAHQVWGAPVAFDLISPKGLDLKAAEVNKVRMRLLNVSPETDGYVFWTTEDEPDAVKGPVRFTMTPDSKEWQEVVCDIDGAWSGVIDRIRIRPAELWWRGDIWFDSISVEPGEARPEPKRPDVASEDAVPRVRLPGIDQETFHDAFRVLDECMVVDVPAHGFTQPFMAPGGQYGPNWWQLDTSLNLAGAKWAHPRYAENCVRGFMDVQDQNPDGRIDLWGASPVRGQPAGVSSIPRYFEAAYDVARRSDDAELRASIVASMGDYLGYWLSPLKRDPESGLVTAVFEETFGAVSMAPGALAPVDLNVAVALGCEYVAALHGAAGQPSLAKVYAAHFRALKSAINLHCWNERDGVYYNYNVGENAQTGRLIVSAFDPLRSGIAPAERVERLLDKLTDPALFNWGGHGLTSLAKTEPDYVEAVGPYDGRAWLGDVWTMRNLPVIAGLRDAGRHGLAAELAWSTVKTFHGTYTEYVHPTTGSGEGVQRYGWSASQYIQCVVEHLLGVDYDAIHGRLRLFPHIPEELYGETLKLEGLRLPPDGAARLSLEARRSTSAQMAVTARIEGPLPGVRLSVAVPGGPKDVQAYDGDGKALELRPARGADNAAEVVLTLRREQTVRFGPAP